MGYVRCKMKGQGGRDSTNVNTTDMSIIRVQETCVRAGTHAPSWGQGEHTHTLASENHLLQLLHTFSRFRIIRNDINFFHCTQAPCFTVSKKRKCEIQCSLRIPSFPSEQILTG